MYVSCMYCFAALLCDDDIICVGQCFPNWGSLEPLCSAVHRQGVFKVILKSDRLRIDEKGGNHWCRP